MSNHKASKSLAIRVCAVALSLVLLTVSSCDDTIGGGSQPGLVATQRAAREAATHEAAMAIEGIATYEARATREAEATEAAATVAAEATATAAAQATDRPVPSGVCTTPGASCLVEGEFELELYYPENSILENRVNIVFPVDGGAVSGDYLFSVRVDLTGVLGAETCIERHDYPGTLSGNYDPATGDLDGSVHGGKGRWTVLEGCEDSTTDDIGTLVSWWARYDAGTGHVVGGMAPLDLEGEDWLFPFEGYARSEQDKTTEF
jgi:hypothetical protein